MAFKTYKIMRLTCATRLDVLGPMWLDHDSWEVTVNLSGLEPVPESNGLRLPWSPKIKEKKNGMDVTIVHDGGKKLECSCVTPLKCFPLMWQRLDWFLLYSIWYTWSTRSYLQFSGWRRIVLECCKWNSDRNRVLHIFVAATWIICFKIFCKRL